MTDVLRVGSLFSGIGGFDLGLERTGGFRTVWFCEQDEFCRHVLAQHWPGVPCYPDVTRLHAGHDDDIWCSDCAEPVDMLVGGFPCQDLSCAGKGEGLAGARSGLWSEYARLVGELRPRYVIVENVAALLARGLGTVLGDLAALGYDAEWDCIPASAVGAPHQRDRIWLVAYPNRIELRKQPELERGGEGPALVGVDGAPRLVADADSVARATGGACARERQSVLEPGAVQRAFRCGGCEWHPWSTEPNVGRVADGVPARMDRLRALGNALVPQIPEWIGNRILEWEASVTA